MKKSIIAAFAAGVLAAVILFSVTGCFGTLKVNTGSYTTDTSVEKKLAEMKSVIDAYAIDEFDEEKAKEGLYYGYMLGLTDDKYAAYYSEEDYKKIVDDLQGNFGGIGLQFFNYATATLEHGMTVYRVLGNSPAEAAGLKIGDVITSVNGKKLDGMTYEEAKKALNKIDLGIKDGGTQASERYDAGEIIFQSEDKGDMIKKNTTIVVVMSSGVGEVSVPDVKGLDETSAINKLQDNGFKYSRDYANSDTVASGQVISQTPDVGAKAKKGDSISIVVSQGKAPVVVPKVVGKSETDARNELSGAGLTVTSVTKENSDTVAAGNVISQSIADGKYVDAGSNISLVISDGPKITYYKFSAKITAPADNDSVVGASIVLKDSNGAVLEQWNSIAIESFPYSIQKTDIAEMSSGKLEITWSLSDGTEQKQVQDVTFNKQ